jgi:DegV family protein with EDD domain
MKKVKVITDSNSGILQSEASGLGIIVVPMPFIINGEEYLEEISLSQKEFYKLLETADTNVSTSQPSEYYLQDLWDTVLKEYDEIVYIPMSSGLSAACSNAMAYAEKYEGKVQVVNNQRISVTQKESVLEAIELVNQGKSAKEIKEYLEETKFISSIYIMVDTLKYLKKGGRVTAAGAALGALLRIKPVLLIRGEKLDSFFKALSPRAARAKMISQIATELQTEFKEYLDKGQIVVDVAYTHNLEDALSFKKEIEEKIPGIKVSNVNPLSLSVSCHIGPGALAIAVSIKKY